TLDSFVAVPTGNGTQVELFGDVISDDYSPVEVDFSGAASGSTTTDAWGWFDTYASSSAIGTVFAHVAGNAADDFVTSDIAVPPPTVSALSITYGSQKDRTVTISGSVSYVFQQSLP